MHQGKIRRLIINVPPRHLKSLLASIAFPAWCLGHDPSAQILCVSYAQELADKHRRQFGGNDLDMPIHREVGLRIEVVKAAPGEGGEILSQQGLVFGMCQLLNHRSLFSCGSADP